MKKQPRRVTHEQKKNWQDSSNNPNAGCQPRLTPSSTYKQRAIARLLKKEIFMATTYQTSDGKTFSDSDNSMASHQAKHQATGRRYGMAGTRGG